MPGPAAPTGARGPAAGSAAEFRRGARGGIVLSAVGGGRGRGAAASGGVGVGNVGSVARRVAAVVTGLLLAVLLIPVGPASAAQAAPDSGQPTVQVSTANPGPGQVVHLTGRGFQAGEHLTLREDPGAHTLGSTRAGRAGAFRTAVALPATLSGRHSIVVVGRRSGRAATAAICVGPCPSGRAVAGLSIRHSDLASGSVALLGGGALALVLLVGGGLMLLAGRRRTRLPL